MPILLTLSPIRGADGQVQGAAVVARDIRRHKRLENEVMQISEMERQRIGQDLHDTLGQILTGIAMVTGVLQRSLEQKSLDEARQAATVSEHLKEAITLTRSLARGLCPLEVEADGLTAAVGEMARNAERIHGVQCAFICEPPVFVDDRAVAMHLYRIAQEAVANATRHAQAKNVTITLIRQDREILLRVEDDGIGIDEATVDGEGMGMHIMRYRAGAIGGALRVETGERGGTVVTCTCPLPTENHSEECA